MNTEWLHKLINEYINEANKYWPNFSFGHSSSGFIGQEGPKSCEFEFYNQQQSFSQTNYYPDSAEFIHYAFVGMSLSLVQGIPTNKPNTYQIASAYFLKNVTFLFLPPRNDEDSDVRRMTQSHGVFVIARPAQNTDRM